MTNSELADFQKKVFDEYRVIKSFRMGEKRLNSGDLNEKKGCLAAPIDMLADLVMGRVLKSEGRKRNHLGYAQEARELLRQKEVSEKICEHLTTLSNREILTEEKFVNELTLSLYSSELSSQYLIPKEPVLYAMMATEVFNIGIEDFCIAEEDDR